MPIEALRFRKAGIINKIEENQRNSDAVDVEVFRNWRTKKGLQQDIKSFTMPKIASEEKKLAKGLYVVSELGEIHLATIKDFEALEIIDWDLLDNYHKWLSFRHAVLGK